MSTVLVCMYVHLYTYYRITCPEYVINYYFVTVPLWSPFNFSITVSRSPLIN